VRRRSAVTIAAVGVAALAGGFVAFAAAGRDEGFREELLLVGGTREPDGAPVNLDATLYVPQEVPAPAVLLAHGYGGTKDSVAAQARDLVERGYVVLTYTARGFGASGGKVHLDAPEYEVEDAQLMVNHLAGRPEVATQRAGDPIVGVAGESYGGALALLLAGTDRRVDAVVPSVTWNDLRQALFPQSVAGRAEPLSAADAAPAADAGTGVFKKQWTALFFGSGAAAAAAAPPPSTPPAGQAGRDDLALRTLRAACGRIASDLCLGYVETATTGRPSAAMLERLAAASPARVAGRITAPTMLIQGQNDSLFPLSEADATARAIAANGTPVSVVWTAGGHDGGPDETERLRRLTGEFLDRALRAEGGGAGVPFAVTVPDAAISSADTNPAPQLREAEAYPGLPQGPSLQTRRLPLDGGEQLAISPPGATPAAVTTLPGLGGTLGALAAQAGAAGVGPGGGDGPGAGGSSGGSPTAPGGFGLSALPGQVATFQTEPLSESMTVVGAPRVSLRVRSTTTDATFFASLVDVAPDGSTTLPRGLVSPVRLEELPVDGREITVALPAVVHDVPAGHRLRVVVSSTDQAYALPGDARGYRIALAGDGSLSVPQVPLEVADDGGLRWLGLLAVSLLAALVAGGAVVLVRGYARRRRETPQAALLDVPLAIRGLGKAYANGLRAVDDLTLRVERGQVLGLLGPNGAGKTTTLRMLMGLIHPTEGELRVFGHRVVPGAAVLSRVGAFVEGPGFLPHLTGLANLRLYWQATGRPEADAHLAEALEVAGLGDDVNRTVRTYSHGMKQRLAIAQAMLGLPELLVLDEPTNGLDPPQIREMREVLGRYAATGRTVVVSSHLLAEVEETCTHVAVMHLGRLIAAGPVTQLVDAATVVALDVDDANRAAQIARVVRGVSDVRATATGLAVRADHEARAELMRALALAGIQVDRMAPQRGLEQAFLSLVGEDRG
jgi:ABC-2 type transport system ATP-binding protein